MKRTKALILIASLVVMFSCGGRSKDAEKTVINMEISGVAARSMEAAAEVYTYYLVLQVTGPDLRPPLVFINRNYILGSDWFVDVPNGVGRTFNLIIYELRQGPSYRGFSSLTVYRPLNGDASRTFDLTGGTINIPFPMQPDTTGRIGTNNDGQGLIKIDRDGEQVPVKACGYTLEAYLIDPALPTVELGPAEIFMGGSRDGAYLLDQVPLNKTMQLKVVRPDTGWTGISDSFVLNSETVTLPVDVPLSGWTDLTVAPAEFPVPNGEVGYLAELSTSGGWQADTGNQVNNSLGQYAAISVIGSEVDYRVNGIVIKPTGLGLYGASTIDQIIISEKCDRDSSALARAWWYRKPIVEQYVGCFPRGGFILPSPVDCQNDIPSRGPTGACIEVPGAIPLEGSEVSVFGSEFDNPASHGPRNFPELFLDHFDASGEIDTFTGAASFLQFQAPPRARGFHDFWVRNLRSNPLFPDFEGYFEKLEVWYSDTVFGGGAY
jgi:hypothetical protein